MERINIERAVVLAGAAATFSFAALLDADTAQAADISTSENPQHYSFPAKTPLEMRTAELTGIDFQTSPEPTPLPQNYQTEAGLSSEIAVFTDDQFHSYIDSVKPMLSTDEQTQLSAYLQEQTLRYDTLRVNNILPNSGTVELTWDLMQSPTDNSLIVTAFSRVTSNDVRIVRANGIATAPKGSALIWYTKRDNTPDVAVLTPHDGQRVGAFPTNETGANAGAQLVTYTKEGDVTTTISTLAFDSTGTIQQVPAQSRLTAEGKLVGGIRNPSFGFSTDVSTSLISEATKQKPVEAQSVGVGVNESYSASFAELPQALQARTELPDTDPNQIKYDAKRFGFVNNNGQVWRHGSTPDDKNVEAGWMNQTDEYTTPNTNTRFVLEVDPKGVGYKDRNHELTFTPLMKEKIEAALNINGSTNLNSFQNKTVIVQYVSDFDLQASHNNSDYLHAVQGDAQNPNNTILAYKVRNCASSCVQVQIFVAGNIWEKQHPDWFPDAYWFTGAFEQSLKLISDGPSMSAYDSVGANYNASKLNKIFSTFSNNPTDYLVVGK